MEEGPVGFVVSALNHALKHDKKPTRDYKRYFRQAQERVSARYGNGWNLSGSSRLIAVGGIAWGAIDLGTNHTTYTTTSGITKNIYKANGQVRSVRAAQYARWSRFVKGVSYGFAAAGLVADGVGVYNYYYADNPNAFTITPAKAGLNTFMTGVGLSGGPVGWGIAGSYFLIDATIGWDNALQSLDNITRQNQAIHGAGWSPFGNGPKNP